MARLIFLGRLMDAVGHDSEQIELPSDIATSVSLRTWLDQRYGLNGVLTDKTVRIAIYDEIAAEPFAVSNNQEIVFFPPVGGG